MKPWIKTGIFIVLGIGMVFLSGCAAPVSTGTVPVTPPAAQIVNETAPATPSLAPTTAGMASPARSPAPAAVVTQPTTPVPDVASGVTAEETPFLQATPPAPTTAPALPTINASGYNKSMNTSYDLPSTIAIEGVTGSLLIHVGAGSADGLTVYIARNGTDLPPFDSSYDPLRYIGEGQNPGYLHVKILPDGNSAIVNLMPGSYLSYLPDRSGGQPEEQTFTINPQYLTSVTFTGHAAGSSGGGCGC